MVVEILGAKMLSPYFGLSHFVWTAQIAVTLVALAIGYYTGGRLADRKHEVGWLFVAMAIAGIYMVVAALICTPVSYWCLDFNLAAGSLMASTILFFPPLALLAMACPILARVLTASMSGVGTTVGRLTAVSTFGSFLGTLLIGYLIIPLMRNSVAMLAAAILLLAFTVLYAVFYRSKFIPGTLALLGLAALGGWALHHSMRSRNSQTIERFFGNSNFGQLQVIDRGDLSERYYLNDFLIQNTYDPGRKQSMSHFTYMLSGLARVYHTNIHDVLCIGLGVGIVPMDFARAGASVDVVEINPAVIPVAQRFFDLDPAKIHLTVDDGRHYLNRCRKKYDVVVLDAFLGDSSPSHLLSREAFTAIRNVLRPDGILTINSFGDLERGQDFFLASLNRTLTSVFSSVNIHTSGDGGMFFTASTRPELTMLRSPDFSNVHPAALEETRESYANLVSPSIESGIVLTDDYNPADYYDAKNREELRRRLALSAKAL